MEVYIKIFKEIADIFNKGLDSKLIDIISIKSFDEILNIDMPLIHNFMSKLCEHSDFMGKLERGNKEQIQFIIFLCILAAKNNRADYHRNLIAHNNTKILRGYSAENIVLHSLNHFSGHFFCWYKNSVKKIKLKKGLKGEISVMECFKNKEYTLAGSVKLHTNCNFGKHKNFTWEEIAENDPKYVFWVYENIDRVYLDFSVIKEAMETIMYKDQKHINPTKKIVLENTKILLGRK